MLKPTAVTIEVTWSDQPFVFKRDEDWWERGLMRVAGELHESFLNSHASIKRTRVAREWWNGGRSNASESCNQFSSSLDRGFTGTVLLHGEI
jgi:hypothetical protein